MKVLHVSGARSWGGNEQQLMYLIDELDKLGVEQKIFCFTGTPLFEEVKNHPVEILAMEYKKPHTSAYRKFFRNLVEQHKIDVIHLHTSDSVTGFVVTDLFKVIGIPTVFAKKGVREKNSILSKYKYNYPAIDRIIVISEYVRENFKKVLKRKNHSKMVTVHNGIKQIDRGEPEFSIRKKLGLQEELVLFGNIANHTRAKDLMTLVKAVEIVVKKGVTNFHLVQMGSPSKLTPEFKKAVEAAGISPYFTFLGFVANAVSFMPQLDALVISSKREGGPSSLMEAFSQKTAVITTRVGVVEEVIENGRNGFFVEPENPEALAQKLIEFIRNPELEKQFGDLSFEKYRNEFTAEHLGKKTLDVYKELVTSKRNLVH